jgi:hypothetical protein
MSPPINDWVSIFASVENDLKLSRRISAELDCPVLHTGLVDGEIFCYWFFESGEISDEYASDPTFFDRQQREEFEGVRGNPEKLTAVIPEDISLDEFKEFYPHSEGLEEDDEWENTSEIDFVDGYALIEKFTTKLGIDNACYSYYYAIFDGQLDGLLEEGFFHLGFVLAEKVRNGLDVSGKGSKPRSRKKKDKPT